ncbi:MAG: secretin N-terminal domain-containing protein [Planctomycetota bacterium]
MIHHRLILAGLAALSVGACNVAPKAPEQVMQVVVLEHADPVEVAATLTALLGQALQDGQGAPTARVRANAESNSIVLAGEVERVRQSLELIARLDVPAKTSGEASAPAPAAAVVPASSDGLLVIYLENTLAADMQETLDEFLQESEAPRDVRVRMDEATNTLLLSGGSSKRNEQLLALVKRLDRKI